MQSRSKALTTKRCSRAPLPTWLLYDDDDANERPNEEHRTKTIDQYAWYIDYRATPLTNRRSSRTLPLTTLTTTTANDDKQHNAESKQGKKDGARVRYQQIACAAATRSNRGSKGGGSLLKKIGN